MSITLQSRVRPAPDVFSQRIGEETVMLIDVAGDEMTQMLDVIGEVATVQFELGLTPEARLLRLRPAKLFRKTYERC